MMTYISLLKIPTLIIAVLNSVYSKVRFNDMKK